MSSSEKNPLPSHYNLYHRTSEEEIARIAKMWDRETVRENREAVNLGSVVEEEPSKFENGDVIPVPDIAMGDGNVDETAVRPIARLRMFSVGVLVELI